MMITLIEIWILISQFVGGEPLLHFKIIHPQKPNRLLWIIAINMAKYLSVKARRVAVWPLACIFYASLFFWENKVAIAHALPVSTKLTFVVMVIKWRWPWGKCCHCHNFLSSVHFTFRWISSLLLCTWKVPQWDTQLQNELSKCT
jgi:hypothetical protein